ncbi:MAG: hypothetical protein KDA24_06405 [Deltaproteobacteria bacterium]|nr:hypothetical protein [Deltaproteobacteria bacterium]
MPLYTYRCNTCGSQLEILHRIDVLKTRCGLDCQRRDAGAFGKGEVERVIEAPRIQVHRDRPTKRQARRAEARRQAALARMGGGLSESEIDKLKKGGLSVYRKESEGRWERDGGAGTDGAPAEIVNPKDNK